MRRFLFLQMGGIYGILYLYGVYAKPRIYFVRSRNLSVALERGNDMKKRLFSLLLVLTLCFTLLPYSAAAVRLTCPFLVMNRKSPFFAISSDLTQTKATACS